MTQILKTKEEADHLARLLKQHGHEATIEVTARNIKLTSGVTGKKQNEIMRLFHRQQVVRKAADSNKSDQAKHPHLPML